MPDIGVLQLSIQDNSQQAGKGVAKLAGALERIKAAIPDRGDWGLSSLNKEILEIRASIPVIKALSDLGKNLTALSKIGKFSVDTKSFEALKTATQGWEIGTLGTQLNSLRLAMQGEWGGENVTKTLGFMRDVADVGKTFTSGGTAQGISEVTTALKGFIKTVGSLDGISPQAAGVFGAIRDAIGNSATSGELQTAMSGDKGEYNTVGENVAAGVSEGMQTGAGEIVAVARELARVIIDTLKSELEVHSPSRVTAGIGRNTGEGLVVGLETVKSEVQTAASGVARSAVDGMQSVLGGVNISSGYGMSLQDYLVSPLQSLGERFMFVAGAARDYKDAVASSIPVLQAQKEMALAVESKQDKAGFSQRSGDELVASMKRTESEVKTSVDNIKDKVAEVSTLNLPELIASSTGIGEALRGLHGAREQVSAINAIAQATGMSVKDIVAAVMAFKEKTGEVKAETQAVAQNVKQIADDSNRMNVAGNKGNAASIIPIDQFVETYSHLDYLKGKIEELKSELDAKRRFGLIDKDGIDQSIMKIRRLQEEYDKLVASMDNAEKSSWSLSDAFSSLGSGLKKMFPAITGIVKQFKNMVRRMAIRAVIRSITSGVREGVENLYYYSKAVGTTFAPAMDNAASSLAQMKNSIGAMLAPAIQALIPVLQTVVNWFINLMNYVNQFFALLNGQSTWTRALYTQQKAYEDNTKAAKKSSKAAKDLLADWDELNIIQSKNKSAASATTDASKDYKSMFEEVSNFNDGIRAITNNIKEQFGSIASFVKKIGTGIFLWKVSNAFAGLIGKLSALAGTIITLGLVFDVSTVFTKSYLDTGKAGWLLGDILSTLVGGSIAKKFLSKVIGKGAASVAIPLTFAISAAATIVATIKDKDVSALSEKGVLAALTAGTEGGVAIGSALFSLGGYTLGTSLLGGIGGGLFTFGLAVGIKAVADKIENGNITADTIKANLTSGAFVGAGLALTELALGGSAIAALTLASGGAILTIGALFAIEAIISKEPEKVRWGDYKATKEEIENFVNDSMYKDPPKAKISLIDTTVEDLKVDREKLTESISSFVGTIEGIKVGIMTKPDELNEKVNQLVSDYNSVAESYQHELQVALNLVPITGGNGKEQSAEIIKNSSARWTELNQLMSHLGTDLADAYKIAYDARLDGNIDETAEKTIKEITDMMTKVAKAISTGQARAKVGHELNMQIQNLSKETLQGILDEYKLQRDALIKEMAKIRRESAEGVLAQQYTYEELAKDALEKAGGNTQDATYRHYIDKANEAKTEYETLVANVEKDAEKAADSLANSEAVGKIGKFMLDGIVNSLDPNNIGYVLADALGIGDEEKYYNNIKKLLTGSDVEKQKAEIQTLFDGLLSSLVGEDNFDTYKQALETNVLKYSDLFDKEFINALIDSMGLTDEQKEKFNNIMNEIFTGESIENPEMEYEVVEDPSLNEQVSAPGLDSSAFNTGLNEMLLNTRQTVGSIRNYLQSLSGLSVGFETEKIDGGYRTRAVVKKMASGGYVRSGDLVMANENGNFEMMGRMGNQPVVANNQQIVSGISQGVEQANSGVESRLGVIENLLNRILNKEFVARAVPSSGWGEHNARSREAYDKVTG